MRSFLKLSKQHKEEQQHNPKCICVFAFLPYLHLDPFFPNKSETKQRSIFFIYRSTTQIILAYKIFLQQILSPCSQLMYLYQQSKQTQLEMTQSTSTHNVSTLPCHYALVIPYSLCVRQDFQDFIEKNQHFFSPKCCHQGKGKWTYQQQDRYVRFLINNQEEMKEKMLRKSKKVFLKMSELVKTRTLDQCRSHHQKVLSIHKSLEEIIRYHSAKAEMFGSKVDSQTSKQATERANSETPISDLYKLTSMGNHFRFQIEDSRVSQF